jgi:hypothetical protein
MAIGYKILDRYVAIPIEKGQMGNLLTIGADLKSLSLIRNSPPVGKLILAFVIAIL